VGSVYFIFIT